MFYVIQTNTSLDGNNTPQDFQSCMYKVIKNHGKNLRNIY